jgi:hypothetical protein
MLKILAAAAALLAQGAAILAIPASAQAQDARLAHFQQANAALRQVMARPDAAPGLDDPAYAKEVSDAFDLQVIPVIKDQPLGAVLNLCAEPGRTGDAYMQQGLAPGDLAGLEPKAAAARAREAHARNAMRFQDELGFAGRFEVACMAVEVDKLDAFIRTLKPEEMTPARRQGLAQMQDGLAQLVSNAALSLFMPIRPGNREARLDMLADDFDSIARSMTPASRQKAAKTIDGVLQMPALSANAHTQLAAVRRSLDQAPCNALCSAL